MAGYARRGFAMASPHPGNRPFTLDYHHAGRQQRMVLGRRPEWSLAATCERAKGLRRGIGAGGAPPGAKEARRDTPRFKDLAERYAKVQLLNPVKTNALIQRSMLTKRTGRNGKTTS